ncbi:MAG: hypothetical protein HXY20_13930 [Acidobacteria bacterium]|nr:hypothetical protein [Acidobacteriota bacterium]
MSYLIWTVDLFVADESRNHGEAGGVRRSPSIRAPVVSLQIKESARACHPAAAVKKHVVELVQVLIVAIDDQHVPVGVPAEVDVSRLAALDPARLRDRLVGDRIEWIAPAGGMVDPIAFIGVEKLDGFLRLAGVHDDVREAIDFHAARRNVAAKVGMKPFCAPAVDEIYEQGGARIERSRADI